MSIFDRRPHLRWAVPATAVALIVGGVAVGTAGVSADAGLPERTAAELLVALQSPQAAALSGTVDVSADLGLPELPTGPSSSANLEALMSGHNTLRVWVDGDGRSRVDLLGGADEYDVIRNGSDVWVWSSTAQTADHYVLPDGDPKSPAAAATSMDVPSTPQEAAAMALAALDSTTEVTTSGVAQVAGRPVYELILTPRQSDTLVARVVIALDGETNVPLRVQVFSTQLSDPAFEVGFTSVDFAQPDPGVFDFTPPPGATVTEHRPGDAAHEAGPSANHAAGMDEPTAVGAGWSRVIVTRAPIPGSGDDATAEDNAALAMLESLPRTTGDWGTGRVLSGTLVSAILTDDGRVAVGAVAPETLGAALAQQ